MTPVALERFRPFMKRPYRLRVGSVKHPPAVPADVDKAHLEQNAQVLRNRRLLQPQRVHNLPHRPFLQCKIVQDCPPPRLRHRIESIRSCRRSCHGLNNTFPYGHMSSIFSPPSRRLRSRHFVYNGAERNLSSSLLSAQVTRVTHGFSWRMYSIMRKG